MRVEESIIINKPAAAVFAFFDNRHNDGRWMKDVIESQWENEEEPTRVGRKGRMKMKAIGVREFADEVTAYHPGRLVAHRAVSGPMIMNTSCSAVPEGDGCRVTVTYEPERLPGGLLGRLTEPLTSHIVRRNYRRDLGRLKSIIETEVDG